RHALGAHGNQEVERQRLAGDVGQADVQRRGFGPKDDYGLELAEAGGAVGTGSVGLAIEGDEMTAPHERRAELARQASVLRHMTDQNACHAGFPKPRSPMPRAYANTTLRNSRLVRLFLLSGSGP